MTNKRFYKEIEFGQNSFIHISNYLGNRSDLSVAGNIRAACRTDYWNDEITVEVNYPALGKDVNGMCMSKMGKGIAIVSGTDSKTFRNMVRNLEQITKSEATLTQ